MLVFSQKVWKKMCSYSYNFHIPICTRSPPIGSGQLLPIPARNLEIFLCFVRTTVSTLIRAICTRVHITSHPDVGLKWTYLPLKCAIRPAILPSHGDACDDDHHDDNAFLFSTIFSPPNILCKATPLVILCKRDFPWLTILLLSLPNAVIMKWHFLACLY